MRLVLMGPPGAGKGTQGERISKRYGVPRYSTGDILRAARREGTELGREAERYMDAGELVPDVVILGMMRETLTSPEADGGFLLDGFPRTVAQAEGLDALLEDIERTLDRVVTIEVADEEIVRRLSSRRVCGSCGVVAGAEADAASSCAVCGGALRQRADDTPETVMRRLEVYHEQTSPVLDWYARSDTPMSVVDGVGEPAEVELRIVEVVER